MHQPGSSQPSSTQDQVPQSLVHGFAITVSLTARPRPCTTWPRTWGLSLRLVDNRVPLPDQEGNRLTSPIPDMCLVRSNT